MCDDMARNHEPPLEGRITSLFLHGIQTFENDSIVRLQNISELHVNIVNKQFDGSFSQNAFMRVLNEHNLTSSDVENSMLLNGMPMPFQIYYACRH